MSLTASTVDYQEVTKFSRLAHEWWDAAGPLKTLHHINPVRMKFINQHLSLKGLRVLDVGCGGGILSEALARSGAQVTGIDADEEVIQAALHHAREGALSIEYACVAIEDYEAPSFDCITCMELLEHVANPEVLIQQCKRLLKPGGLLFVSTINRTVVAYAKVVLAAEYLLGLLPRQTHDYSKFIKPSELLHMAQKQGFRLLDLQGMEYAPFTGRACLCSDPSVNYLMVFG